MYKFHFSVLCLAYQIACPNTLKINLSLVKFLKINLLSDWYLKEKFSVIGPHYIKAPKTGHYQTSLRYDIKKIHNVHGSTIFFNKKIFMLPESSEKKKLEFMKTD